MSDYKERTCFTCKHAIYHAEIRPTMYDPGEPAWAECNVPEMSEEIVKRCADADWDEKVCPNICGMWERASKEELIGRFELWDYDEEGNVISLWED